MLPDEPAAPEPVQAQPMPLTPVCFLLTGLCVLFYLVDIAQHGHLFERMDLYGPDVKAGEWWRVFTCTLAHGGALHLLFNLSAVWTLGRMLEAGIGTFRFAVTTVLGALGSAFGVLLVNFEQPTLGISGVILAWAGAMLPIATKTGRRQLGTWLVQVLIISLLPHVSWAGHAGGFVFGIPAGWVMRKGPAVFRSVAPLMLFAGGVLVYLIGSGRLGLR